jgi:hypothetical protein
MVDGSLLCCWPAWVLYSGFDPTSILLTLVGATAPFAGADHGYVGCKAELRGGS